MKAADIAKRVATTAAQVIQSKPKLNFGSLTQASTNKPKAKSYPQYPGDTNTAALVDSILETDDQMKAAEAANKIAKADLIGIIMPWWLQQNTGRTGVAGSVLVSGTAPKTGAPPQALTTFKDQYSKLIADTDTIANVIGVELAERLFTQRFKIEIDSDKVPSDKLQLVIDAVHQIATQIGVSEAISVKPFAYPLPGFNEARHLQLTVEQNAALESIIGGDKRFTAVAVARKR